jgi:MFS family permease
VRSQNEGGGKICHPRFVITTTILASSLAFVDGSVVNVGLPAIGASLRSDGVGLQWIVNAYLLPLSALLLLGGAAGDRFGRRRLLMIGVGVFGTASLACAMAPSLGWLLAARFVQGISAAMLMPSSLAISAKAFLEEQRVARSESGPLQEPSAAQVAPFSAVGLSMQAVGDLSS